MKSFSPKSDLLEDYRDDLDKVLQQIVTFQLTDNLLFQIPLSDLIKEDVET